jgi:hypothetical protein
MQISELRKAFDSHRRKRKKKELCWQENETEWKLKKGRINICVRVRILPNKFCTKTLRQNKKNNK